MSNKSFKRVSMFFGCTNVILSLLAPSIASALGIAGTVILLSSVNTLLIVVILKHKPPDIKKVFVLGYISIGWFLSSLVMCCVIIAMLNSNPSAGGGIAFLVCIVLSLLDMADLLLSFGAAVAIHNWLYPKEEKGDDHL